jgi:carboxyl-terminal processing protease
MQDIWKAIRSILTALLATLALCGSVHPYTPGDLFDRVVDVLDRRYYDREYRRSDLPALVRAWRPEARAARSFEEEREVVHAFLSRIPVSHLALLSEEANRRLQAELSNRDYPTLGLGLVRLDDRYFVAWVLEGGPADRAGIRRWDRIVEVDGVSVGRSPRLDWRSDDAHLPDPPSYTLVVDRGEAVTLLVERSVGRGFRRSIEVEPYSAFRAARASVRSYDHRGRRIGYLHLRYMHFSGAGKLLADSIKGPFADHDGLILDLRGRGGSTLTVTTLLSVLGWAKRNWGRPIVVLVDRGTRSAKEILAHEIRKQGLGRIVGETTAGAVIPATFEAVGHGMVLMYPAFSLGDYTRDLEGKGVRPDLEVADSGPYSAGADPILDAALRTMVPPARRAL